MDVISVNSSGFGPLKKFLAVTSAQVVLAQETRVGCQDSEAEASAWCTRQGWKSLWCRAIKGPRGGMSAGTAIFARKELGLLDIGEGANGQDSWGRYRPVLFKSLQRVPSTKSYKIVCAHTHSKNKFLKYVSAHIHSQKQVH